MGCLRAWATRASPPGLEFRLSTYQGHKHFLCLTSLCLSLLTCKMGINDWVVVRNQGVVNSKQLEQCLSPYALENPSSWGQLLFHFISLF